MGQWDRAECWEPPEVSLWGSKQPVSEVVVMTPKELRDLPPIVDVATAAQVLGVGRGAAYELVRTGGWPTPIIRLGRLIKIPTAPLLALLGQPIQATKDEGSSADALVG